MKRSILLVEDNTKLLNLMENRFRSDGFEVYASTSLSGTADLIGPHNIGVIVLDLMLKDESGMDAIELFMARDPTVQIIIATGYATVETAVEAMKKGVYDYIQKPVDISTLRKTIENAFRYRELKKENSFLKRQLLSSTYCLKTNCDTMRGVFEKAQKLGRTELPILILGESGTGKEVLADFIHMNSMRANEPILKVNSSAFPEGLLENELFGHEKDAFTGATSTYKGLFEQSNGGTLFLDEISDMSLAIQAKILRTLQNNEIRRIGASQTIHVDVRLIAATNLDPEPLIVEKKFREDLYYRINTAVLRMPALRDRREDIPLMIDHFLKTSPDEHQRERLISDEVQALFLNYSWPGNIRELKNVIEYSMALAGGDTIRRQHLPPLFQTESLTLSTPGMNGSYRRAKHAREEIIEVLAECKFNKKQTAAKLGISRKTLYEKLKKYEIDY